MEPEKQASIHKFGMLKVPHITSSGRLRSTLEGSATCPRVEHDGVGHLGALKYAHDLPDAPIIFAIDREGTPDETQFTFQDVEAIVTSHLIFRIRSAILPWKSNSLSRSAENAFFRGYISCWYGAASASHRPRAKG